MYYWRINLDQAAHFLTFITKRPISNIGHKNCVIIEDYNDFLQTLRPISRPTGQNVFLTPQFQSVHHCRPINGTYSRMVSHLLEVWISEASNCKTKHVLCRSSIISTLTCSIKVYDSHLPSSKFVSHNPIMFSCSSFLVLISALYLESRIQISVHRWITVMERIVITSFIFYFLNKVPVK
jgi:hypothetical protein